MSLPQGSAGKESACDGQITGDEGLIPGLERSPGGGNGNSLQYSCLKNPMDRGAWQAIVHGVTKESDMTEQLSTQCLEHSKIFTEWIEWNGTAPLL